MKKSYALITGASSGIGKVFASQLAKKGYPLILVARREERLKKIAKKLPTHTIVLEADLSDHHDREQLIKKLSFYEIDILINNAGFGDCGEFLSSDLEKEMNMIEVNITALHFLTKKLLPSMVRRNSGYILNVASSAGLFPAGPYMTTYYATKAYVTSFTRGIATELKDRNSKVYIGCLCPGPVDTEFNRVANVKFALQGITPEYCVRYALKQMKKRKTVIIPTLRMKLAVFGIRLISGERAARIVSGQQKKKLYPKK